MEGDETAGGGSSGAGACTGPGARCSGKLEQGVNPAAGSTLLKSTAKPIISPDAGRTSGIFPTAFAEVAPCLATCAVRHEVRRPGPRKSSDADR